MHLGSLSYFPFLKKWQCAIYFSPGAKLAIYLKKREREDSHFILYCTLCLTDQKYPIIHKGKSSPPQHGR